MVLNCESPNFPSPLYTTRAITKALSLIPLYGVIFSSHAMMPTTLKFIDFLFQAYDMRNAGAVIHSHGMESCIATMINPSSKEFRVSLRTLTFVLLRIGSDQFSIVIIYSLFFSSLLTLLLWCCSLKYANGFGFVELKPSSEPH